jgi:hypothetical protein
VRLYDATVRDREGTAEVKMHVVRVDLTTPGVSVRPLMRSVAQRSRLSQLARGHRHLVVAANTGYFDYATGAPTQPLIVNGQPLVISARPQRVVGLDADGALQSGSVKLAASVVVNGHRHRVVGINTVTPGGIVAFDQRWGSAPIPTGSASIARPVVSQRLGPAASPYTGSARTPADGYELVGRQRASIWLSRLPSGLPVQQSRAVETTAPRSFVQAYGVGTALVVNGSARSGLSCHSAGTKQPARTAIGSADHGTTLVIGEVEDRPGTNIHGLDEDQMAGFMAQLRVDSAWDLDGSGSTELLARMPGAATLSMRTHPADGSERPMPVGLGITYRHHR